MPETENQKLQNIMATKIENKTVLSLLPAATPAHRMALAGVVSSYGDKDTHGDYVMTTAQARDLIPVLIIRGINQPMLAKTLASHLTDKKGKGIFGLLALANDERKAFRSLADKSDYRAAKSADGEKAMAELTREDWTA